MIIKPLHLLLYNMAMCSVFPMALLYSFLCIKLSCVFINELTSVVDTTKRMSILLCPPPGFSSYCDDEEPISTYISLFLCLSFATRHINMNSKRERKRKLTAFRSTVVRCCFPENNKKKVHILIEFQCFQLWFFLCTWQWV